MSTQKTTKPPAKKAKKNSESATGKRKRDEEDSDYLDITDTEEQRDNTEDEEEDKPVKHPLYREVQDIIHRSSVNKARPDNDIVKQLSNVRIKDLRDMTSQLQDSRQKEIAEVTTILTSFSTILDRIPSILQPSSTSTSMDDVVIAGQPAIAILQELRTIMLLCSSVLARTCLEPVEDLLKGEKAIGMDVHKLESVAALITHRKWRIVDGNTQQKADFNNLQSAIDYAADPRSAAPPTFSRSDPTTSSLSTPARPKLTPARPTPAAAYPTPDRAPQASSSSSARPQASSSARPQASSSARTPALSPAAEQPWNVPSTSSAMPAGPLYQIEQNDDLFFGGPVVEDDTADVMQFFGRQQ